MAIRKVSLQSDLRDAVLPSAWVESQDCVQFIRNALRRAFSRTRLYSACRNAVRREIVAGGRRRVQHRCASCGGWFFRADTQVDHITCIEPVDGSSLTWDQYVARLFTIQLQCLCKPCHAAKSTAENALRRAAKKAIKQAKVGQFDATR